MLRIHTFPKNINLIGNVIERRGFELTYYNVSIQYVSHIVIGYISLHLLEKSPCFSLNIFPCINEFDFYLMTKKK